jgi:hypothetical protein
MGVDCGLGFMMGWVGKVLNAYNLKIFVYTCTYIREVRRGSGTSMFAFSHSR